MGRILWSHPITNSQENIFWRAVEGACRCLMQGGSSYRVPPSVSLLQYCTSAASAACKLCDSKASWRITLSNPRLSETSATVSQCTAPNACNAADAVSPVLALTKAAALMYLWVPPWAVSLHGIVAQSVRHIDRAQSKPSSRLHLIPAHRSHARQKKKPDPRHDATHKSRIFCKPVVQLSRL